MTTESFGRYEIRKRLGKGGMATVYLAHDPRFDREVALKVLPEVFLHDDGFRQRFEREARIIARLEHKAIVPVYDFGEHNNQPYLVMRHMVGGSLSERLEARKTLSSHEVLNIVQRIASALDEAHQHGIIHRDLKPGNILFDQHSEAYLADFGIAKLGEATASLTGNTIVGTPAYMSPEQVHGRKSIDGRSDIYTLGIILYELLTGDVPYQADTPVQQMMAHVLEPIPDLPSADDWEMPEECSDVIRKALSKEPDQRHNTASELAFELTEALGGSTDQIVIKRAPSAAPPQPDLADTKLLSSSETGDAKVTPSLAGQRRPTSAHGDKTTSFTPEEMSTFGASGVQTEIMSAETILAQNRQQTPAPAPTQSRNVMWLLGVVIALLVAIVTIGIFYIVVIEGDFDESEADEEAMTVTESAQVAEPTATATTAVDLSYESNFLTRLDESVQPFFTLPADAELQFEGFDESYPQIEFLLVTDDPNALLRQYQETAIARNLEEIQIDLYTADKERGFLSASGLSDNRYFDVGVHDSPDAGVYVYNVAIIGESHILDEEELVFFDEEEVIFEEFLADIDPELRPVFSALVPEDALLLGSDISQPDFPVLYFDTSLHADQRNKKIDELISDFDLNISGPPIFDPEEESFTMILDGLSRGRVIQQTTWTDSESTIPGASIEISITDEFGDGIRQPLQDGRGPRQGNGNPINGAVSPPDSLTFYEREFLPNIPPDLHPYYIFRVEGEIVFVDTREERNPVLEYELSHNHDEIAADYRTELTEAGLIETNTIRPNNTRELIYFQLPDNRLFVLDLEWDDDEAELTMVSMSIDLPRDN